jgi:hypothetical protein
LWGAEKLQFPRRVPFEEGHLNLQFCKPEASSYEYPISSMLGFHFHRVILGDAVFSTFQHTGSKYLDRKKPTSPQYQM